MTMAATGSTTESPEQDLGWLAERYTVEVRRSRGRWLVSLPGEYDGEDIRGGPARWVGPDLAEVLAVARKWAETPHEDRYVMSDDEWVRLGQAAERRGTSVRALMDEGIREKIARLEAEDAP